VLSEYESIVVVVTLLGEDSDSLLLLLLLEEDEDDDDDDDDELLLLLLEDELLPEPSLTSKPRFRLLSLVLLRPLLLPSTSIFEGQCEPSPW